MKRTLFLMGFLGLFLALPLHLSAQDINVTPDSWDFGDVEVGQSVTQIFTLESLGPTALTIFSAEILDDPTSVFSASSTLPVILPWGESTEVTITFLPSSLGAHTATLHISSNAMPPRNEWDVPLQGVGVSDEGDPSEQMADLLAFFDASVADGSVVGDGPGNSAQGRLKAFGNMLDAADDLIAAGEYDLACEQLQDAYNRADGVHPPPDFIRGDDMTAVAAMILDVMEALGCP